MRLYNWLSQQVKERIIDQSSTKIINNISSNFMIKQVKTKQKIIQLNITLQQLLYKKKTHQRKETDVSFYTLIQPEYHSKQLHQLIREKQLVEAKVSKSQRKKWFEEERNLLENHKHALQYLSINQVIFQDRLGSMSAERESLWKQLDINIPKFDKDAFQRDFQQFLSSKTRHITDMDAQLVIGLFLKWQQDCASFMTSVQKAIVSSDVPLNLRKFIMSYVELFYIQDLYLQVPSFMDTMIRFDEKYAANIEERYQYRLILKKKSIIFKIKLFIEKQLQAGRILNCGESLLKEFKGLVLGKQYHFVGERRIGQDDGVITITNWKDTRYALQIMGKQLKQQIEASKLKQFFKTPIKIEVEQTEQQKQVLQQKQQENKPKKKKKKAASKLQDKQQEQQNKKLDQLSQFLQKLQINDEQRIQCRLDDEWKDVFARKVHQQIKPKNRKENFKFKNFLGNNQQKKQT